jgi:hypothetical protein
MARKRTSNDTPSTETTDIAPDSPVQETATAIVEAPGLPPAQPVAAEQPVTEGTARRSFADRVAQTQRSAVPDPFGIAADYIAGVRLFESKQDRQMAIKFDDKPSQAVIDRMKEAGYRWNPVDRIWAHPIQPDSARTTRIEAEQLYQEVRQMIRKEKGFEAGQEVPF